MSLPKLNFRPQDKEKKSHERKKENPLKTQKPTEFLKYRTQYTTVHGITVHTASIYLKF